MSNLQLSPSLPAATEKQLETHIKNIRLYATGVARSGAQFFGYAFLAGREINKAAEILPHGELLPWIKQNFPDVSESATRTWRGFAEKLEAKFATVANLPPLLKGPNKPKKTFSEKECSVITEVVNEAMDGNGMMEFMRGNKLLREPKAPAHHPIKEKKISDEEAIALAKDHANEDSSAMAQAIESSNLNFGLCDDKEIMAQCAVLETALKARRKWLTMPKPRDFAVIEHDFKNQ